MCVSPNQGLGEVMVLDVYETFWHSMFKECILPNHKRISDTCKRVCEIW